MSKFTFCYIPKNTEFESTLDTIHSYDIIGKPKTSVITSITPKQFQKVVIEAETFELAEMEYKRNYLPRG